VTFNSLSEAKASRGEMRFSKIAKEYNRSEGLLYKEHSDNKVG